jgi:hypothetical protein
LNDRFLTLLAHGGDKLDWSAIGDLAGKDAAAGEPSGDSWSKCGLSGTSFQLSQSGEHRSKQLGTGVTAPFSRVTSGHPILDSIDNFLANGL